jgi:SAM-dependent methyltransferase
MTGAAKQCQSILRKVRQKWPFLLKPKNDFPELNESLEYLSAYRERTDAMVKMDPKIAIGGKWEELGKLQINFLIQQGLTAESSFLDIGCGTLRGGRHFIRYLNPGKYYGMDLSKQAIEYGKQLIIKENLINKKPQLIVNDNLKFQEFSGQCFDFMLAQSVFTHLKPEHIQECLLHIRHLMQPDSRFFFTFHYSAAPIQTGSVDFRYPFSWFQELADQYGFNIYNRSLEYAHPRQQWLAEITCK